MIEKDIASVGAKTIKWFSVESNEVIKALQLVKKYNEAKVEIENEFNNAIAIATQKADKKMMELQIKTKEELACL